MKCPNCGIDNPDNYVYCGRCGAIVMSSAKVDRQKVDQIKGNIKNIVRMRKVTDQIIPPWWLAAYIGGAIIAVMIFFVIILSSLPYPYYGTPDTDVLLVGVTFFCACMVALSLFLAMLIYYLVRRQNEHYHREWDLRANILNLFKALAGSPEREYLIYRDIAPMLAAHQKAETVREPRFWAAVFSLPVIFLAVILPILISNATYGMTDALLIGSLMIVFVPLAIACVVLGIYMFYFLGKEMYEHDRRWAAFSSGTRNSLVQFGIPLDWTYAPQMLPQRDFAIYFVLSLFIPFFTLYWWYTLIVDPNNHFKNQWKFEKWIVGVLDQLRY